MIKVKLKRFIAMTMATIMTLSSNAFATEINLENSSANVNKHGTVTKDSGSDTFDDETTNVWQGGSITEEVRVNVDVASSFTITIPKEIVLNGNDGSATYKVKCEGDIAGDQVISVVPDASFTLNEDGGKSAPVIVTQNDTDFTYVELNDAKEYSGDLSAPQISAGNWSGSFYFNIEFKGNSSSTLPAKADFNDMSWTDIATVSEAGEAANYFNVGDEKELVIGEYSYYDSNYKRTITHPQTTYHIQIIGFNHDDKSDRTGKAGITVGLKEIMATSHNMNSASDEYKYGDNIGGWKDCEMRAYLQNDVYNALPNDVKSVIKTVDKISNAGNTDTTTLNITQDTLFLLSPEEIKFNVNSLIQGTQYEYFANNGTSIKKTYLNGSSGYWWLRSTKSQWNTFYRVDLSGTLFGGDYVYSEDSIGVVFAFCI